MSAASRSLGPRTGPLSAALLRLVPVPYLPVAFYLAYTDLRRESVSSFLGLVWWVVEPLVHMVIFYFLFAVILNTRTENFLAFLLIGLTLWRWLNVAVIQGALSVAGSSAIISQVYLPKMVFPVRAVITNTLKFGVAFVCLCVFLALAGLPFHRELGYLPLLLLTQFSLILALSLWLSVLVAFVPDVQTLLTFVLRAFFYVSGVLFDVSRVPDRYRVFVDANPIAVLLGAFRDVLLHGDAPALAPVLAILAGSLLLMAAGLALHARLDHVIPKIAQ